MTLIEPLVHLPPGMPVACIGRSWERSRFTWSLGEPGDPAELVGYFLGEYGLGVPPAGGVTELVSLSGHARSGVCGAALLVSAADRSAQPGA